MDINQEGRSGFTPLIVAIEHGHEKITEVFLKMGANPNVCLTSGHYPTALEFAIEKANENHDDPEKQTQYNNIIELLLQYGAKETKNRLDGYTALHFTAALGDTSLLKLLIKHGFNPTLKDRDQKSAIDYAYESSHPEAGDYLSNYLHVLYQVKALLSERLPKEIVETIRSFLFNKVGKISSKEGILPAVGKNDLNELKEALSEGYIINDAMVYSGFFSSSRTPLEMAVEKDNMSMAALLIKHSVLTEQAYKLAPSDEMKQMLIHHKQEQMQILKEELDLEEKDPTTCTLEM